MDFYVQYMRSPEWRRKRATRIALDENRCIICRSVDRLEVHHNTYKRLGNERLTDLVTVCRACHEVITSELRRRRYELQSIEPKISKPKEVFYVEDESSFNWSSTIVSPQQPNRGSAQLIREAYEEDLWEAFKNRGRLRGDGED